MYQSPLTLTENDTSVSFDDIDKVKKFVQNNESVAETFAKFKGNGNAMIQKQPLRKVKAVFERLRNYAKSRADASFSEKNIPTIDGNEIKVTEYSVPIFSGLIENKIIERLLNGDIEIPYYSKK